MVTTHDKHERWAAGFWIHITWILLRGEFYINRLNLVHFCKRVRRRRAPVCFKGNFQYRGLKYVSFGESVIVYRGLSACSAGFSFPHLLV